MANNGQPNKWEKYELLERPPADETVEDRRKREKKEKKLRTPWNRSLKVIEQLRQRPDNVAQFNPNRGRLVNWRGARENIGNYFDEMFPGLLARRREALLARQAAQEGAERPRLDIRNFFHEAIPELLAGRREEREAQQEAGGIEEEMGVGDPVPDDSSPDEVRYRYFIHFKRF
ncbi:hypothetical protein PAEPH01_2253 [Pancytospora epiphaga]|nr:hypothetical protein PAEPH01_2253 [Pancytospora epiphaga]